jgi:hypothetical protein
MIFFFEERRVAVSSKRFNVLIVMGIFALLAPILVCAQDVNYAAEVLTKGAGARPLAMGGAFAAAANDATAAYWNPAGLALIDDTEITTMHATENDLQSYDFINLAFNTQSAGSYALSYMRLGVDGIQITNSSGPEVEGTTSYADQAGFISGGWKLGKQFAFGGTIKFLQTSAYTASAFGIGSDLGLLFKPIKEVTFGLVARDFTGGSYIQWQNTPTNPTQVLQPSVTLGISYTQELGKRQNQGTAPVPGSTLTLDFDADSLYLSEGLNNYHFGAEYWYRQFVAVRAGFITKGFQFDNDDFTPSAGVGIWAYLFEIDYAYVSQSIGGINYLSLITRL